MTIQAEVQFGNMSRWYSDIFKFQMAYAQNLIQMGLSVIPMGDLARRIDSNIVNFERAAFGCIWGRLAIAIPVMGLRERRLFLSIYHL
ncbi:MAG: hypothetical protein JXA78_19710 [Anaerolineales bacterium]|nr:hypothetical protein [Anaerolineales bacterium]